MKKWIAPEVEELEFKNTAHRGNSHGNGHGNGHGYEDITSGEGDYEFDDCDKKSPKDDGKGNFDSGPISPFDPHFHC